MRKSSTRSRRRRRSREAARAQLLQSTLNPERCAWSAAIRPVACHAVHFRQQCSGWRRHSPGTRWPCVHLHEVSWPVKEGEPPALAPPRPCDGG